MKKFFVLLIAVALCFISAMLCSLMRARSQRARTNAGIAAADRLVMTRFGLSDYRVQFNYTTESRSYIVARISHFLKGHASRGLPGTREEEHVFSSGARTLQTKLYIYRERLQKAEITSTPESSDAAHAWARKVTAEFPQVEIVVNGLNSTRQP